MFQLLRSTKALVLFTAVLMNCANAVSAAAANEGKTFDGQWRTSRGIVNIEQSGENVTGTFGKTGQIAIEGTVAGNTLTFNYQQRQSRGEARWTLDASGRSFRGSYQVRGGRRGGWNGWRPDPDATNDKPAKIDGLWLTNQGLMELEQTGNKIAGRYAFRGTSQIDGTVAGRKIDVNYNAFRPGRGWFDVAADGDSFAGAAVGDGSTAWYGWRGRRAPEFARHAKLVPGEIVDGSTNGLLTYSIRAPEGYREGQEKKWPAVVILHGSNMNGKAYVNTIARSWPEIARDYLLIGINGERPSSIGKSPRFNFSYVSYVGRSTFKGYPGTDRESPALVAEALDELREVYPVAQYFVGGHSQGGFLTYSLLMNFPEKIAGAFPISAGVIFQCEPSAYTDEPLRAAQRSVPLAIIHGKTDRVVAFDSGEYAAVLFGEAGWPAFRFFADNSRAGHRFALLPVGKAIRWLESQTSDDAAQLLDFAERRMKEQGGYRDALSALNRAGALKPDKINDTKQARLERMSRKIDAEARAGAAKFLPKIRSGSGGPWIDEFLAYRDDFEFAPAAREVMQEFNALRAQHDDSAQKLINEARAAFRMGKRDAGYDKYEEIVRFYYAASSYRNVNRWLSNRK